MRVDGISMNNSTTSRALRGLKQQQSAKTSAEVTDDKTKKLEEEQKKKNEQRLSIIEQLKEEQKNAETRAESAEVQRKCMVIASRIIAGDKVPWQDYAYLAKHDSKLYAMALTHRIEAKKPKKYKRLSEDEKEKMIEVEKEEMGAVKDVPDGEKSEGSAAEGEDE